jgi:hypothetical protein
LIQIKILDRASAIQTTSRQQPLGEKMKNPADRGGTTVVLVAATLWLGMLIGVSFIATPVKFTAPTLSLSVALDVGRVTFGLFAKVEWLAAAALLVAVLFARPSPVLLALTLALAAIVAVEGAWPLPVLTARIEAVIDGAPMAPSNHHILYVALEAAKALCLIAVLAIAAFRIARPASHSSSNQQVPA